MTIKQKDRVSVTIEGNVTHVREEQVDVRIPEEGYIITVPHEAVEVITPASPTPQAGDVWGSVSIAGEIHWLLLSGDERTGVAVIRNDGNTSTVGTYLPLTGHDVFEEPSFFLVERNGERVERDA